MAKKKTTTRKKQSKTRIGSNDSSEPVQKKGLAKAETASESSGSEWEGARVPVVGIGASAGGLDAFKKFFDAMPSQSGMAFVLVPHLDPNHKSLMVDLLANHTAMPVCQAEQDMPSTAKVTDFARAHNLLSALLKKTSYLLK